MHLAGVVLQIRVRHERNCGVEDRRRREHPLAVGIQGQKGLQEEDDESNDERQQIEQHESNAILLPVLRAGIHATFDPVEPAG